MKLINSEYTFSLYENLYSVKDPTRNIDINQLIEIVKYGYLKDNIDLIRSADSKTEYNKLKSTTLPCITTSGEFVHRKRDGIVKHSGLIQIDLDNVNDYEEVFNLISIDKYTYVCFRSPGGKGIKVIVKILPSAETHLNQFYALQNYFKNTFAVEVDKACKDIARAMLLSSDPDIFCNPHSVVFEEILMPTSEAETSPKGQIHTNAYVSLSQDAHELVKNIVDELTKNNIDITTPYENWIKVGYSLVDSLGENGRTFFHEISMLNPDYLKKDCDHQYDQLLKNSNGSISIATLIYLVKLKGIGFKSISK